MVPPNKPWLSESIDPDLNLLINRKVNELNHIIIDAAARLSRENSGTVDEMVQNRFFLTLSVISHLAEGTTFTHNKAMKTFMSSLKDPSKYT